MSEFYKEQQRAWFHDQGDLAGFFHTYDRLQLAGVNDAPRKVHVFLPREYENVADRYPVIYMNDGDTAFFRGGLVNKSWWTAEVLSELYCQSAIRKVIVVAVYPINRDREYTHALVPTRAWGGVENYSDYLANCVKPFIDRNYRTLPEARETSILGSSHGGLAAFYIACRRADCFGNAGALSPSFWVGLDTGLGMFLPLMRSTLLKHTSKTLSNKDIRPKIWLSWGLLRNQGFHNFFVERNATKRGREMANLLINQFDYEKNQELFIYEDPLGEHSEDSWHRHLPLVLKSFYGR